MSTPSEDTVLLQQSLQAVDNHVSNAARSIIREVSTDTQFLNAGQREIIQDVHGTAIGTAHGQSATDRNVDHGFLGVAREHATTDRNVDAVGRHLTAGQRIIDQEVNHGFLGVARGQASTDKNVDHGVRHLDREIHDLERETGHNFRETERGQRWSDDRNSDGFYRVAREVDNVRHETSRGFAHTNEEMQEGFAHTNEEMSESFGDVAKELYGAERRLDNTVRNGSDAAQARMADAENRLTRGSYESEQRITKDVTSAERRLGHQIDRDVTHSLEEVSEALASHDRRVGLGLERLHGDVRLEAERTRETVVRTDLETRLYLRDREDRQTDLLRGLSERNLDEMRGFERRTRDNESKTRDLIRHMDEERSERDFISLIAQKNELKTELAILKAESRERCCDPCCSSKPRYYERESIRVDPRINITLDDYSYDENDNDNTASARSRSRARSSSSLA